MITHNKSFFVVGEMIDRRTMQQMGLPIGNAHLPPFKQREMPFAPLGAAFAAVGAATTVGATALAVVNAVAVTAMYAGVAMTVVGMVTGDKELMKIGGIVGLAGGVTSLAAGGIASLAAGSELSFGTAGIESLNAANAASSAAETTAMSGALANAGGAITPELANVGGQVSTQATGVTANLGNAITPNFSTQLTGQAANTGILGASGTQMGTGILNSAAPNLAATGATQAAAAASGGTFLDKFMASLTPKDYVIGGFSALSGGAQMMQANQANAERQRQYEYQQGIRNQQIQNLNTVPTLTNKLDANAGLNANAGL